MFQYPPLSYNNCKRQIQNFIISNEIEQEMTRIKLSPKSNCFLKKVFKSLLILTYLVD